MDEAAGRALQLAFPSYSSSSPLAVLTVGSGWVEAGSVALTGGGLNGVKGRNCSPGAHQASATDLHPCRVVTYLEPASGENILEPQPPANKKQDRTIITGEISGPRESFSSRAITFVKRVGQ